MHYSTKKKSLLSEQSSLFYVAFTVMQKLRVLQKSVHLSRAPLLLKKFYGVCGYFENWQAQCLT